MALDVMRADSFGGAAGFRLILTFFSAYDPTVYLRSSLMLPRSTELSGPLLRSVAAREAPSLTLLLLYAIAGNMAFALLLAFSR